MKLMIFFELDLFVMSYFLLELFKSLIDRYIDNSISLD